MMMMMVVMTIIHLTTYYVSYTVLNIAHLTLTATQVDTITYTS